MTAFQPMAPDFAERVRASFARQLMMATIGASLEEVRAGEVVIALSVTPGVTQQHGFVHGGAVAMIGDSACGYAALSLAPSGVGVLTVEFKVNFVAPAAGARLLAQGRVVKPGRTISLTQSEVYAELDGTRKLVALMTSTVMTVAGRDGVAD